ncbi:TnpV protein [Sedimentibacter sp. zth1]|nr:TnpV protein [Sedimentibacter sp. zth1]QSX04783.1 TnpV protein [Sedimentibacter sp. zth1]
MWKKSLSGETYKEKYIYDEKNGLWYEKQGEYYLPCITLPDEKQNPVGVWLQRHLRYIKQYNQLMTIGQMACVGKMNTIRNVAMEAVSTNLIYN